MWSVKATIYCGLASFIGSYRETTESTYHSLVLLWSFFSFKGRILIGWQTINYKVGLASHQRLLQCVSLSTVNIWWKHKMRSFLSQQLQWLVKVQRNTPPQPSSASLVVECVCFLLSWDTGGHSLKLKLSWRIFSLKTDP